MAGMGRHQEASESFSKAIKADWYYAPAWNNKGVSQMRLGEVEEALISFRRAVVLRENFPEAWYNLGLVFGELGDPKLSREAFKKAEDLGYKATATATGGGYVLATEEGFMGKTSILMLAAESRGIPGFWGVAALGGYSDEGSGARWWWCGSVVGSDHPGGCGIERYLRCGEEPAFCWKEDPSGRASFRMVGSPGPN